MREISLAGGRERYACQMDVFIGCPLRSAGSPLYDDTNGFLMDWTGAVGLLHLFAQFFLENLVRSRQIKYKKSLNQYRLNLDQVGCTEWQTKWVKKDLNLSMGKC